MITKKILLYPLTTEKAIKMIETENKIVFVVKRKATKAEIAEAIGIEPKVALLSFSTKGSGGGNEKTLKIREAVKLTKEKNPSLLIDGEMQFDAAINPYAAERKCPDSPLKGDANVLIFPDLNAGNIFVHGMFQITDMEALFTLTAGLRHPVGILGRSTPTEYIVNMLYAMAMECNENE